MFLKIRNNKLFKLLALQMVAAMLVSFLPLPVLAVGGGPSGSGSFTANNDHQLVNPYTGDLNYNIPLLNVGGYPINLSYSSGIAPDQEASMVGLGWNLNIGAITRDMRGLPDEFAGEKVKRELSMKPNNTFAVSGKISTEVLGFDVTGPTDTSANLELNIFYDNYTGVGYKLQLAGKLPNTTTGIGPLTANLGKSFSFATGTDGIKISGKPGISLKSRSEVLKNLSFKANVGTAYSSRSGLSYSTLKAGFHNSKWNSSVVGKIANHKLGKISAKLSYSPSTYTPQIEFPQRSGAISIDLKGGPTVFGVSGYWGATGSFSTSSYKDDEFSLKAYGYMNAHKKYEEDVLQDFNRENDGQFGPLTANLPVTNFTHDLYSISAQGVGGTFRAYRSDIGVLHDNKVRSNDLSGDIGLEFAGGNLAQNGIPFTVTYSTETSGRWNNNNDALEELDFQSTNSDGDSHYEPWYFRLIGETSADQAPAIAFNQLGGTNPAQLNIEKADLNPFKHVLDKKTTDNYGNESTVNGDFLTRDQRTQRNVSIHQLQVHETENFAVDNSYFDYTQARLPSHHPGEITVLQGDGARYVFGLPVVNHTKEEATFNVSGNEQFPLKAQVAYDPNEDDTKDNDKGVDHMYDRTTTPAYAHSHLLTAVLSHDYSDADDVPGPSEGDHGNYVQFKYGEAAPNGERTPDVGFYQWRSPFEANRASLNEGLKTLRGEKDGDDKGSYIYGKKDLWYIHEMVGKTHIAIFEYSNREDGYGVAGQDGGIGTQAMKRLDKIQLYARPDYEQLGGSASPIKTVHFAYDYSLCGSVPDNINGGGKLTLKNVSFTYGNSKRGKLSPYVFGYSQNPAYASASYDMWGGYHPNAGSLEGTAGWQGDPVLNAEYPYTEQDRVLQDNYASAWCLDTIHAPSGATTIISYEADDYNFVQDKPAMQMFKVVGAGNSEDHTQSTPHLYENQFASKDPKLKLFFEIPEGSTVDEVVRFLKEASPYEKAHPFFYNFLVDLDNEEHYEYVKGYALLDTESNMYGESSGNVNGQPQYGWIQVKPTILGDNDNFSSDVHPIAKTAWGFGKKYNSRMMYGLEDPDDSDLIETLKVLSSMFTSITDLFRSTNRRFREKNFARGFDPDKSWIRLFNPSGHKLAGTCRVKRIRLFDDWDFNTQQSEEDFFYGQDYIYEMEDSSSSGVASFEPLLSRENPFIKPIYASESLLYGPRDPNYSEGPIGLSFFPAAHIGYRRVEVKSLDRYRDANDQIISDDDLDPLTELVVKRHSTGKMVYEYFTALDFPTLTSRTRMDKQKPAKIVTGALGAALKKVKKFSHTTDYLNVSQGFLVEKFDDIYGKEKASWVYGEDQNQPISGVEYKYKVRMEPRQFQFSTDPGKLNNFDVPILDNNVPVLLSDGSVYSSKLGMDVDVVADFRESQSRTLGMGFEGNIVSFLVGILPVLVPPVFPDLNSEHVRFRSASLTKVISRKALVSEVVVHDLGASVATQNLAWDGATGEVLLTQTQNAFEDTVYAFSYPSHWAYPDGMGQAYKNILLTASVGTNGSGQLQSPDLSWFRPGDELMLGNPMTGRKAWIIEAQTPTPGLYLVDRDGEVYDNEPYQGAKVIRSGRRNRHALGVGTVLTRENPLVDTDQNSIPDQWTIDNARKILGSSANTFSEDWRTWAAFQPGGGQTGCSCNEYTGVLTDLESLLDAAAPQLAGTGSFALGSSFLNGPVFQQLGLNGTPTPVTGVNDIDWLNSPDLNSNGIATVTLEQANNFSCEVTLEPSSGTLPTGFVWTDLTGVTNLALVCQEGLVSELILVGEFDNGTSSLNYPIRFNSCMDLAVCAVEANPDFETCAPAPLEVVNPYVTGLRGVWRGKKSWSYLGERSQASNAMGSAGANQVDLRQEGIYTNFTPYWTPVGLFQGMTENPNDWTWGTELSVASPFGQSIESRDALFRYSGKQIGYSHTLPVAVGNNCTPHQIGFEGFEDYDFANPCLPRHLTHNIEAADLTQAESHTGRFSAVIAPGEGFHTTSKLRDAAGGVGANAAPYTVGDGDLLFGFSPETYAVTGQDVNGNDLTAPQSMEYVVGYWIREAPDGNGQPLDYLQNTVDFRVGGNQVIPLETVRSEIIDGWQRLEYLIEIPGGSTDLLEVSLTNLQLGRNLFVDDFRIHPLHSTMMAYVYDPVSLRLWAELDGNNFATLYEYDEEGKMTRVKKETERGILTLKEMRSHIVKKGDQPETFESN